MSKRFNTPCLFTSPSARQAQSQKVPFAFLAVTLLCLALRGKKRKHANNIPKSYLVNPKFYFSYTEHRRFASLVNYFKFPILYAVVPGNFKGSAGRLFSIKPAKGEDGCDKRWTFFSLDPKAYVRPDLPFETKFSDVLLEAVSSNTNYCSCAFIPIAVYNSFLRFTILFPLFLDLISPCFRASSSLLFYDDLVIMEGPEIKYLRMIFFFLLLLIYFIYYH